MTRKCFLVDRDDLEAGWVTLGEEVAHHVRDVLRLRPGDAVELRDGRGHAWDAVLGEMTGREVRVALGRKKLDQLESPLHVTLGLAFSRSDRMELALRQATEMGVDRFVAFPAERSEYRLRGPQLAKRKERWRRIAFEALCQCGRLNLPDIQIYSDLDEYLSGSCSGLTTEGRLLKLLAREDGPRLSLLTVFDGRRSCREMHVVVGPEGGWAQPEGERFLKAGFFPVHLGPRTLRLETATVALLAAVQTLWGDLGSALDLNGG